MPNQQINISLVIFFFIFITFLLDIVLTLLSGEFFFPGHSWEPMGLANVTHVLSIFTTKIKILFMTKFLPTQMIQWSDESFLLNFIERGIPTSQSG